MKIVNPKVHAVLDYIVAIFLIAAPYLFNLSAFASTFSIALGLVHFLLSLATIFKGGAVKLVPFPVHGLIEFFVSLILGLLAFTIFRNHKIDQMYYTSLAFAILLVFILTDYKAAKD